MMDKRLVGQQPRRTTGSTVRTWYNSRYLYLVIINIIILHSENTLTISFFFFSFFFSKKIISSHQFSNFNILATKKHRIIKYKAEGLYVLLN